MGKSNILLQFAQKKFKTDHEITIGVEFGARNLTIGDKIFRIQIWDTVFIYLYRLVKKPLGLLQELIIKTVFVPS